MEQSIVWSSEPSEETPWYGHVIRVRYQETDRMDVVFHGNYVTWFEVGRTEWIRALGIEYRELEAQGLLFPVTGLNVAYKRPAKYDDLVVIYTRLGSLAPIRMAFQSVVCRIDESQVEKLHTHGWVNQPVGEMLVEGGTSHAWVSSANWRPVRIDREQPEVWSMLQRIGVSEK
ncbi:acyl-CoA thioesterase [Paenibacillus marinisediminis]